MNFEMGSESFEVLLSTSDYDFVSKKDGIVVVRVDESSTILEHLFF